MLQVTNTIQVSDKNFTPNTQYVNNLMSESQYYNIKQKRMISKLKEENSPHKEEKKENTRQRQGLLFR